MKNLRILIVTALMSACFCSLTWYEAYSGEAPAIIHASYSIAKKGFVYRLSGKESVLDEKKLFGENVKIMLSCLGIGDGSEVAIQFADNKGRVIQGLIKYRENSLNKEWMYDASSRLTEYFHAQGNSAGKIDFFACDHGKNFHWAYDNCFDSNHRDEALTPRIISKLIDFQTRIEDLIREDNGNTQVLEIIVDPENPENRAVSWQWWRNTTLSFGWEKSLQGVRLSREDLQDLILKFIVSGSPGVDFNIILEDNSAPAGGVNHQIVIPVADYVTIDADRQSVAIPLDKLAGINPDFDWSKLNKLKLTPVSNTGQVVIQTLDIENVRDIRSRGIGTIVFQDNKFTPIDNWYGLRPTFIMSFKDLLDIASGDLLAQFHGLAEHQQLPYLTLEFWQMDSTTPEEQKKKKEQFIARYGQDAYDRLFSQISNEDVFTNINQGDYDFIIRDYARAIARFGRPVLFRAFHEFNGSWYPWSIEGGKENEFIAAWKRIHEIFRHEGAHNAIFVFSPYILDRKGYDPVENILAQIKDEVDIIACDGYGPNPENPNGPGFNGLFTKLLYRFERFHLPMIIGEFGSELNKAAFFQTMDKELRAGTFSQLIGITYFDIIKLERGVLRDFGVSTIPDIMRDMQGDVFYRLSAHHLIGYINAYNELPHYYWGGFLPRSENTVDLPDTPQEKKRQITVTVEDNKLFLIMRSFQDKNKKKFDLNLITGKLTIKEGVISPAVDKEQYLTNIKTMYADITEAAHFAQKKPAQRELLKEANYLNMIVYRMENPDTSSVTMPVLSATVYTDSVGKITIDFVSGTLFQAQLNELWAEVKYDGTTEYWFLNPSMLSSDGKLLTMRLGPAFNGKVLGMRFYGIDTQNRQTLLTNTVTVHANFQVSSIVMPTVPASVDTDSNGMLTIGFISGTLFPSQLNELWAEVKYDGKIEYWFLHPSMLSVNGTSFVTHFGPAFNGKVLQMRLYGIDTQNRQTPFTDTVTVHASFQVSSVVMPVLPSIVYTDVNRLAQIKFISGTLFQTQLSQLWGEVKYDGKTEYWGLSPYMLSSDGKYLNFLFEPKFSGKALEIRFYGFDTVGKQTDFTNPVIIHVQ